MDLYGEEKKRNVPICELVSIENTIFIPIHISVYVFVLYANIMLTYIYMYM